MYPFCLEFRLCLLELEQVPLAVGAPIRGSGEQQQKALLAAKTFKRLWMAKLVIRSNGRNLLSNLDSRYSCCALTERWTFEEQGGQHSERPYENCPLSDRDDLLFVLSCDHLQLPQILVVPILCTRDRMDRAENGFQEQWNYQISTVQPAN